MNLDPVIGLLLLASFALLFASAALQKWRNLPRFAEALAAYQLLPSRLSPRVHVLVPLIESLIALGLLAGVTRRAAAIAGALLLLCYATAIAANLLRGRRDIACGCGGPHDERTIAAWMVWRNVLLAGLLAATLWPWRARALLPTDWLTVGFGLAATIVIHQCGERLAEVMQRSRSPQRT